MTQCCVITLCDNSIFTCKHNHNHFVASLVPELFTSLLENSQCEQTIATYTGHC